MNPIFQSPVTGQVNQFIVPPQVQQMAQAYNGQMIPQLQQIQQMCQGQDPKQVFYAMCQQRGIDPNVILSQLGYK